MKVKLSSLIALVIVAITLAITCISLPISIKYFSNINNPWKINGIDLEYTKGNGPGYVTLGDKTYYINENNILSKGIQLQDGSIINSHGIKVDLEPTLKIEGQYDKLQRIHKVIIEGEQFGHSWEYIGSSDNLYNKLLKTKIHTKDLSELSLIVNMYNTTYNLSKDIPSVTRQGFEGYDLYIREVNNLGSIRKENKVAEDMLDKLVSEALTYKTEREQVKYIYDWLIKNVTYSFDINEYSVYDTLYNKQAVCEGFARTFYQACKRLGIQVRYIHGTEESSTEQVLHTWNAVKFTGESTWNYYDATWDSLGYQNYDKVLFFEMSKVECDKRHREECIHE